MKLSIIIVTYNSEADINGCLHAIYSHNDLGADLEVIVVDNGSKSQQSLFDSIHHDFGEVTCISNLKNGGYGQGNNIGVGASSGNIVMIMNPDVRWQHNGFRDIVNAFDDDQVIQVGFTMMETSTKEGASYSYASSCSGFLKSIGNTLAHKLHYFNSKKMYFSGACFAIRKEAFDAAGRFDERIFLYGEENDLHYRLLKKFPNGKIVYLQDITYFHPIHSRPYDEQTERQRMLSNIYVLGKQGISKEQYLHSEISRLKWDMSLLYIKIDRKAANRNRQKISLYQSLIQSV